MKTETVLLLAGALCIFFSTFFGWFYVADIMEEHKILRICGNLVPFIVGSLCLSWDTKKKDLVLNEDTLTSVMILDLFLYGLSGIILYSLDLFK